MGARGDFSRASRLGLLGLWLAAAGGCENTDLGEAEPLMGVAQQRIEFGAVAVGDTATRQVFVQNTGRGRLNLSATIEADPDGAFSVPGLDSPIQPFVQGAVVVAFHPPDIARYEASLVLTGNDENNPRVEIALAGSGYRRGAIEVVPDTIDFGTVAAGEVGQGTVTVRNVGNGQLKVTGIAFSAGTSPDFHILSSTRTPAYIAAGKEVPLRLAYRPGVLSQPPGEGRLEIQAADPFQPVSRVRLLARLNQAPLADAGPDREVDPLTRVELDGSASQDPDGDLPLAFDWRLVRKPEGSSATLDSVDQARVGLTPDLVGVYEAELFVTDATGLRSLLPDRVAVTAIPAERLLVELVWESPIADLDLHLLAPGGVFGGLLDCHWDNPEPDWGAAGDPADDPALLRDDLAGFGPETVGYAEPLDGRYRLWVDYFAAHTPSGEERTRATLRVFVDGFLEAEISRRLDRQGQRWQAVEVLWPEGTVEAVDVLE